MANLRTDYKDDILNTSVNTRRKFNMVNNSDGTVSFEDATIYTQVGDSFGAFDINETNRQIEELKKSVSDGKTIVADAITAKGVETATDADFATMAANVLSISTGNMTQLAKALQYSGLGITEDSTWDEIYTKLAAAYPEILVLWDGVTNLLEPLIYYSGQTESEDYRVVSDWCIYTYNNLNSYRCTYTVHKDISLFNKITFTFDRNNVNDFDVGEIYIGVGKNQNTPDVFYKLENGSNMYGTVELDISELSGNYYIGIFTYMPEDKGRRVGVTTSIKNITLTV